MNNLNDKICPLFGKTCLLGGCAMFNELLDGCEISILNYNLYQAKEHIRAWLDQGGEVTKSRPTTNYEKPTGSRFPRPR